MDLSIVNGLALVRRQVAGSKVLLVRTEPGARWAPPIGQKGESIDELLQTLRAELIPQAEFIRFPDLTRTVSSCGGKVAFYFVGTDADLPSYFDCSRFFDARWASFEEARHIVRGDLEGVVSWSRRLLHKLPLKPASVHNTGG